LTGISFPEWGKKGFFSLCHHIHIGSGFHPAFYPVATGACFPGVKQLGCKADHSPPSNGEVKNVWSYISTPHTSSSYGA